MSTLEAPPEAKIPLPMKLAYGFGAMAFGIKDNGLRAFLLLFYSQVIGLSAALVATVLMIATIIDGVADPIVGQISDNFRSKYGRRHPFMFIAAIPSAALFWAMWVPPAGWSQAALLAYLTAVTILSRIVITFYEIPSTALAAEITSSFHERTSLVSVRYFFFFFGGTGMTFLTYRLFLQPSPDHPIGQLNPAGYAHYGMAAAAVMLISMLISTIGTQKLIRSSLDRPKGSLGLGRMFREMGATFSNKPFLMVTGAGITKSMALGISGSLGLYMNTYYWGLSANQVSILAIDGFLGALLASFITRPISQMFGKRVTTMWFYALSFIIAVIPITLRYFGLFVSNDSPWLIPILFGVGVAYGSLGIGATILATSMIADVVEDSQLTTKRRAEGLIFSASSLINKALSGFGILGAGLILSIISFPRAARPDQVDPAIINNLALYVPAVGILYAIGLLLLSRYGIDKARHEATLRELGVRETDADEQAVRANGEGLTAN